MDRIFLDGSESEVEIANFASRLSQVDEPNKEVPIININKLVAPVQEIRHEIGGSVVNLAIALRYSTLTVREAHKH